MPRRVGVWVGGSFVEVTFYGVIVQGHEDKATYPLQYGFRIGAGTGTSIFLIDAMLGMRRLMGTTLALNTQKLGLLVVIIALGLPTSLMNSRGTYNL